MFESIKLTFFKVCFSFLYIESKLKNQGAFFVMKFYFLKQGDGKGEFIAFRLQSCSEFSAAVSLVLLCNQY